MSSNVVNINWLIIVPVFVILFAVIWRASKNISLFPEPTGFIVSLCVSILCIISMFNFVSPGHVESNEGIFESQTEITSADSRQEKHQFILLPYQALGITVLAASMIIILIKIWSSLLRFLISSRQKSNGIISDLKGHAHNKSKKRTSGQNLQKRPKNRQDG